MCSFKKINEIIHIRRVPGTPPKILIFQILYLHATPYRIPERGTKNMKMDFFLFLCFGTVAIEKRLYSGLNNIVDDTKRRVGIKAHPAQVSSVFGKLETSTYKDVFFNTAVFNIK